MPRNTNMKEMRKDSTAAHCERTPASHRSVRKAPGTRLGLLRDWREGSNMSGKTSVGIGKMLRDGR